MPKMKKNKSVLLSTPYILWMLVFTLIPLGVVGYYALTDPETGVFTLGNIRELGRYMPVLGQSVLYSLVSALICLILGYPVALILTGKDFKRPALWLLLLILPMWMNFLLRTYSWMSILENSGILNSWITRLREAIPALDAWLLARGVRRRIIFLYNENAVILGMVYNYLSFMIMPIYTVIEKIDKSMLEAAADLGASPVKSFMRVTLPYSLPGVLEGITMVFVPAVTTFVISQLMGGGKVPLIGDIIQNQFGKSSDWHFGATLSLLVMVVVLAFMGALNRMDKDDEPVKEVRIL
jgi:spermidine/putrescine transport system permease protein